ncbi:unnamed protein product [Spirodela intermedia]|uniref:BHLH domain-containing protein n=1 Tax=Spirodela intermedia TaxID=51605 RepID=A0A7I8ISR4_SPIIN|nr:unnamed protein product [Spirodela intermedia]CAA6661043.1 unnamed protein product [Spirodela intermedia]
MDNNQALSDLFDGSENLFSMLESLEDDRGSLLSPLEEVFSPRGSSSADLEAPASRKRMRMGDYAAAAIAVAGEGQMRMSHITVERNRRKQMNEHLSVLKSLMPCFYVKRGDQASIIGGVVEYIKELQQVLQSLEAKKQRKVYSEVLSPRPPKDKPPHQPRTPQPGSPYKPRVQQSYLSPSISPSLEPSAVFDGATDLSANSRSPVANVEVKFLGPNVLLKTISPRISGQALRIVAVLERLALEILQVDINTVDDTMLNSFTIKIGIECELSAEDLANEVQQTFS